VAGMTCNAAANGSAWNEVTAHEYTSFSRRVLRWSWCDLLSFMCGLVSVVVYDCRVSSVISHQHGTIHVISSVVWSHGSFSV